MAGVVVSVSVTPCLPWMVYSAKMANTFERFNYQLVVSPSGWTRRAGVPCYICPLSGK